MTVLPELQIDLQTVIAATIAESPGEYPEEIGAYTIGIPTPEGVKFSWEDTAEDAVRFAKEQSSIWAIAREGVLICTSATGGAASVTPDPLANMDAEALRVLVQQLQADLKAKTGEVERVRDQNVKLKTERDDFDKIGKDSLGKMRKAETERDDAKKQLEKLTGQLDTARRRADQAEAESKAARKAEVEAKAAAAESGLRAEAAEQRLAEVTAPRPGGHIIARNITEAELDALTDEGRKVAHFQFMPDGKLNAVIEPCAPVTQPSRPRNQSMVTPSGLPIPPIGRPYTPRVPVPTVPSSNAPQTRALMTVPQPVGGHHDAPTDTDLPKRVPTFNEILAARLSGQIDAAQFTKYANALAGYNAAQKVAAQ